MRSVWNKMINELIDKYAMWMAGIYVFMVVVFVLKTISKKGVNK